MTRATRRLAQVVTSVVVAVAVAAAPAGATPVAAQLTSVNGEGTFDPTIACPAGDGPSWRYAWSGLSAPASSPFGGTWNGTVEVHDDGAGGAFVPGGTGRLNVSVARGGTANLELSGGDCASAPLTLGSAGDEPVVSGSLPVQATGGSGVMRGLVGSGVAALTLQLGPGADNPASIDLNGSFDALAPDLAVPGGSARWNRIVDWLQGRLNIGFQVRNGGPRASVGDAFDVRVVSATVSGLGSPAGLPIQLGRIDAETGRGAGFQIMGARPGRTYTVTVTIAARDALNEDQVPIVASFDVKAPPLPPL